MANTPTWSTASGAGAGQPPREDAGQVGPIGVLELEDQVPGVFIVEAGGARMVERGRPVQAGLASRARTQVIVERRPAAIAGGRLDEGDASPGRRCQAAPLDGFAPNASLVELAS